MPVPKFKQFFDLMLAQNKQLFDDFKVIHDNFLLEPDKFRNQFNEMGHQVQDVVRVYENRLCSQSEGSGYGKFSTNLSDKFQYEVKKVYPKYDFIGEE